MKRKKDEKGAVIVEATLVIPMFVFLVITIMWIANLCTAQAKIQIAINSTAKEISSYSYLYGLTGLNGARKTLSEKGGEGAAIASETISGVKQIYSGLSTAADSGQQVIGGDSGVEDTISSLSDSYDNISDGVSAIKTSYETIKKDPKSFLISLGSASGSIAIDEVAGRVIGGLSTYLCEKHLETSGISTDTYLRKLGVINGYSGVYFGDSQFCNSGCDDIIIVAEYQLSPIKFFNIDIKYNIVQTGRTKAWFGQSSNDNNE